MLQMLHGVASLCVHMPHSSFMYCAHSSLRHPNCMWKECKYLNMHAGVEAYATFKIQKTALLLTIPHHWADHHWQIPYCVEGEVKKCPWVGGGGA